MVATVLQARRQSALHRSRVAEIAEHRFPKTENRSVVGIMNEFTYLGGVY
jgi:hypothetical protein